MKIKFSYFFLFFLLSFQSLIAQIENCNECDAMETNTNIALSNQFFNYSCPVVTINYPFISANCANNNVTAMEIDFNYDGVFNADTSISNFQSASHSYNVEGVKVIAIRAVVNGDICTSFIKQRTIVVDDCSFFCEDCEDLGLSIWNSFSTTGNCAEYSMTVPDCADPDLKIRFARYTVSGGTDANDWKVLSVGETTFDLYPYNGIMTGVLEIYKNGSLCYSRKLDNVIDCYDHPSCENYVQEAIESIQPVSGSCGSYTIDIPDTNGFISRWYQGFVDFEIGLNTFSYTENGDYNFGLNTVDYYSTGGCYASTSIEVDCFPTRNNKSSAIEIYPNPILHDFNIVDYSNDKVLDIEVYDISGKIIESDYNNKMKVSVYSDIKGLLICRIKYTNGNVKNVKVFKK